jgi:predicted amidophosphoribosyltransferase
MEIPRHWRLKAERYRLVGSACPICGRSTFPPRPVCPQCRTQLKPTIGYQFPAMPLSDPVIETDLRVREKG